MPWRATRLITLIAVGGAAFGMLGCAPPATEVSGNIKLRGKAPNIKGLQIVFTSTDGRMHAASIEPDGTYKAAAVPAGDAKVSFAFMPPELAANAGKQRMLKPGSNKDTAPKASAPKTKDPIPSALRDPLTSNVTKKLEAGKSNVFDYDIK